MQKTGFKIKLCGAIILGLMVLPMVFSTAFASEKVWQLSGGSVFGIHGYTVSERRQVYSVSVTSTQGSCPMVVFSRSSVSTFPAHDIVHHGTIGAVFLHPGCGVNNLHESVTITNEGYGHFRWNMRAIDTIFLEPGYFYQILIANNVGETGFLFLTLQDITQTLTGIHRIHPGANNTSLPAWQIPDVTIHLEPLEPLPPPPPAEEALPLVRVCADLDVICHLHNWVVTTISAIGRFLFVPSPSSLERFAGLWPMVADRVPIGYWSLVRDSFAGFGTGTPAFTLPTVPLFDVLRSAFGLILWVGFGFWLIRRISIMQV